MAGAPSGASAASGYLLETPGVTLLIDCGPGVVAALAKRDKLRKLDAVIISHRHADHCADLVALAYARLFPKPLPPLPLFGPTDMLPVIEGLNALFAIPSLPSLRQPLSAALPFTPLAPEQRYDILGVALQTHRTQHPVETLAYKFPCVGLAYTADGRLTPELIAFVTGCPTLLAEATYLASTEADLTTHGHMTSVDAARLAACSGAAQLILTHFATSEQMKQSVREAQRCFGAARAAEPLACITLPG
jgi:ribonuclease BN (tRNA processing enzyme)